MELVEVDAVHLQAPQAALARLPQVLGAAVGRPLARPRSHETALGGDQQVVGVGAQGLGDDVLADLGPVGIGGVDEVHPELDGSPHHTHRFPAPDQLAHHCRADKAGRAGHQRGHGEFFPIVGTIGPRIRFRLYFAP